MDINAAQARQTLMVAEAECLLQMADPPMFYALVAEVRRYMVELHVAWVKVCQIVRYAHDHNKGIGVAGVLTWVVVPDNEAGGQ